MTGLQIAFAIVAAAMVIGLLLFMLSEHRASERREREYQFRAGYRDGWSDCRDGKPPREDFP